MGNAAELTSILEGPLCLNATTCTSSAAEAYVSINSAIVAVKVSWSSFVGTMAIPEVLYLRCYEPRHLASLFSK